MKIHSLFVTLVIVTLVAGRLFPQNKENDLDKRLFRAIDGLPETPIDTIRILIEMGADVNKTDQTHVYSPFMEVVSRDYLDVARVMIEKGGNVNQTSALNYGDEMIDRRTLGKPMIVRIETIDPRASILMKAVGNKNIEMVRLLLNKGADINYRDRTGNTALRIAVKKDDVAMVKLLLENGARAGVISHNDNSILDWAVLKGNREIADMLIGQNISAEILDDALFLVAYYYQGKDMVKYLVEKGANVNRVLMKFVGRTEEREEALNLLFNCVSDINKTVEGRSVLRNAITYVDSVMVLKSLAVGADINIQPGVNMVDKFDNMTRLLIERGRDVNAQYEGGHTALWIATYIQNFGLMDYLIDKGADVNFKDNEGRTILIDLLEDSKSETNPTIVKFLLEKGINVNTKDKKGRTALSMAKKNKKKVIVEILEDWIRTHK